VGFWLYGIQLTPAKCPTNHQSLSNSAPANLCFRASGEILPEKDNPNTTKISKEFAQMNNEQQDEALKLWIVTGGWI
jgi:hypothetical protein